MKSELERFEAMMAKTPVKVNIIINEDDETREEHEIFIPRSKVSELAERLEELINEYITE